MDQMNCLIEGRTAYIDGKSLFDNPYRFGAHAEAWNASRNGDRLK